MPDKWTGEVIGIMHNERVTFAELASKLNCSKAYVSMILNGLRKPIDAEERFKTALSEIIKERE